MTPANTARSVCPGKAQTSFNLEEGEKRGRFLEKFMEEVLFGLRAPRKHLPCKYLYDSRGSQIFDKICELPEYYQTRTELAILRQCLPELSPMLRRGVHVIEYGSGSGLKTRLLLHALNGAKGCTLVEISGKHLQACAKKLQLEFPHLDISAVCADYTRPIDLPEAPDGATSRLVFFPGSTIGNFDPDEAIGFLDSMGETVGDNGAVLIGVDLKKDPGVLEAAYNDNAGVTAAFNLNLLRRLNRELGCDFILQNFLHDAPYNAEEDRIEMHLVSRCDQTVHVAGEIIEFHEGERIHTESSYKYTVAEFEELAGQAGWRLEQVWMDKEKLFSVQYLTRQE